MVLDEQTGRPHTQTFNGFQDVITSIRPRRSNSAPIAGRNDPLGAFLERSTSSVHERDAEIAPRRDEGKALHEIYQSLCERLKTFSDWPEDHVMKPMELAKAGLFYCGPGDKVRCYFCGGMLHSWEPNDDPLAEHKRWFGRCGFLRQSHDTAAAEDKR